MWLREKEHKFSRSSLSKAESSMLSSFNISPHMSDYAYYKDGNQSCIHELGCNLVGLFSWDNAKLEFVKLENNRVVIEVQKACCKNDCFFDPLKCMNDEHDGKLTSLLNKEVHETLPNFYEHFEKDNVDKTLHPPVYDELGMANIDLSKLDSGHVKACKPDAEFELSKLFNIVDALMKSSSLSLETQRKNMFEVFKQKCSGLNMPRLAAMGFGPSCGQLAKYRDYFQASQNLQPEKKWAPFYFWMYTHGADLPCIGKSEKISKPFLDHDGRTCYPCNTGLCHEKCPCEICTSVPLLVEEGDKHDEHLEEYNVNCILAKVQCTDHTVDHPDNFNPDEDIKIEVFNYLDMNMTKNEKEDLAWKRVNFPPRESGNLQEQLKLSGLKRICKVCKRNTNDHILNHHVLHVQCKICDARSKTMHDQHFWRKTCPECMKYFPNIRQTEMKRHIKGHEKDYLCEICGQGFIRQKHLDQHIKEIHDGSKSSFACEMCPKVYKQERNLDHHIRLNHTEKVQSFQCRLCTKIFLYRFSLNRHLESQHYVKKSALTNLFLKMKPIVKTKGFACEFCTSLFETKWILKRHVDAIHSAGMVFTCDECGKNFGRKDSLKRHKDSSHEVSVFSCPSCHTIFSRKDSLLKHSLKHSLEVNYQCSLCKKKFDRKDNCERHKRNVHKQK